MTDAFDLDHYNKLGTGYFPGLIGFTVTKMEKGAISAHMTVRQELMAPNGYLHAGSIVTLADTACGYGCRTAMPEGARASPPSSLRAISSAPRARASSNARRRCCMAAA